MRRAGALRTTGGASLVALASSCHPAPMADPLPPGTIDEALGLRALAALLDGDLGRATAALAATRLPGRLRVPPRVRRPVGSGAAGLEARPAPPGSPSGHRG